MSNQSNQSTTSCNIKFAEKDDGREIPKEMFGFRRIGDQFLSIGFVKYIDDHIGGTTFDANSVLLARKMVGETFWEELTIEEQEALPACLFLLINEGRITFTFPE